MIANLEFVRAQEDAIRDHDIEEQLQKRCLHRYSINSSFTWSTVFGSDPKLVVDGNISLLRTLTKQVREQFTDPSIAITIAYVVYEAASGAVSLLFFRSIVDFKHSLRYAITASVLDS